MNKQEKALSWLAGKQKKDDKESFFDKYKMVWYLRTPFEKVWFILGSISLVYLILKLIITKGL